MVNINPDDSPQGLLRATPERERLVLRTRYFVSNKTYLEDSDEWQIFLCEHEGMSAVVIHVTPSQSEAFELDAAWNGETALEQL